MLHGYCEQGKKGTREETALKDNLKSLCYLPEKKSFI